MPRRKGENMISKRAADAIRSARMKKNMTLADLGMKLGVTESLVSYWESAARGLTVFQLAALNRVLFMRLRPEDVLTDDQARVLESLQD